MSRQLIDPNEDLRRLEIDGYDIEFFQDKYLLVNNIPYVNSNSEVKRGTLVSVLEMAGDRTSPPTDHVAHFIGEHPSYADGRKITGIENASEGQQLAPGLKVDFTFSAKPKLPAEQYRDYHHKMVNYITIISAPAGEIVSGITAKIYPQREYTRDESIFKYPETASSRVGIGMANRKLELEKIAILGIGGTGSYVLDLVSKTLVKEIHIFDGDRFLNHNAFRSPGAASLEELRTKQTKVDYFAGIYSKMRWGIQPHDYYIDETNVDELKGMTFVFICMDRGDKKKIIIDRLHEWKIPFVDVGMGISLVGDKDTLRGNIRTTLSTPDFNQHIDDTVPFSNGGIDNDYSKNIQVAELNALNATLAVVKWKKLFGYYSDTHLEHNSSYVVAGNILINDHKHGE